MGLGVEMSTASAASGLATIVANPFEIAKTRLQVQRGLGGDSLSVFGKRSSSPRYTGSVHAIREIWRVEGFGGLYKGFGGFAGYVPSTEHC